MYINVYVLFFVILATLGTIALVFLIIFLKRISSLVHKIDTFWDSNSKDISRTIKMLPEVTENVSKMTDNLNLVSETATELAASVIDKKSTIINGLTVIKNILAIIEKLFSRKN
ncbi:MULTISPECIES: hypothetical protein [Clostridium]|uniref:hypothetical protein n=1 Tax=Clostridium TaxID=1485 RepID=UPI00082441B4|nr:MULTISPECIES: hypothetical protein [Clostridium]PJI06746.1 hypothetical protein CUB90_02180 [Clostridium sp. CT7]